MVVYSNTLHCEYRQDLQFLDLSIALESYLCRSEEQRPPAELFVTIILLKLCWFLIAEKKLSILLFMFSKVLSLDAHFLDKPFIILAWPKIYSLKGG